ncbi:hypothetical protein L6452_37167 [Arctium lappa]|uniref:Uncharacterized protein n=1 Tax=Arctium lappa TaxID=4217 RepID=A0ACB8Y6F1_ARCLA|nr:hypothetical protein L6452_37167 [Arctium lappa]
MPTDNSFQWQKKYSPLVLGLVHLSIYQLSKVAAIVRGFEVPSAVLNRFTPKRFTCHPSCSSYLLDGARKGMRRRSSSRRTGKGR